MTTIGNNEFVYYKDSEGDIYSGGFQVNSLLMKQGFSPIMTLSQTSQTGGTSETGCANVSDLFDNLVVPNWAIAFPFKQSGGNSHNKKENEDEVTDDDDDEIIDEDIHSKLLSMLTVDPSEMTKKTNKGTRKLFFRRTKNEKNAKKTKKNKK